jgi:glutaredoxin 2
MKPLGYIVTDRKMNDIEGFVEQVKDFTDADSTKPILIVGWNNAKLHRGYKSILEKELAPGVFWTFKKSESRSDFEQDLKDFYQYVYNVILDNIDYYYINIISLGYNKLKKLYSIFNSKERKNIYISDNLIYTLYDGKVLGVSLDVLEYCGVKRDKVLSLLSSNPANKIYDNSHRWMARLCKYLGNKKYAVPYFIST